MTDSCLAEREKIENHCVKVTIGKSNVWVLKQLMKQYLKFYEKYLKLVFSFLFQCSEVMKLNPQQAPLYVSTKLKQFFPLLVFT